MFLLIAVLYDQRHWPGGLHAKLPVQIPGPSMLCLVGGFPDNLRTFGPSVHLLCINRES